MELCRINDLKSASSPAPTATSTASSLAESSSSAPVRHGLSLDDAVGGSCAPARRGIYCDCTPLGLFGWFCLGWKVEFNRCDTSTFSSVEKQDKNKDVISWPWQKFSRFKEARKGFSLPWCLWNDGRLQRRVFNGVDKLYVYLPLYCWALL